MHAEASRRIDGVAGRDGPLPGPLRDGPDPFPCVTQEAQTALMDPSYLDPRTGQTFPLDRPRSCGTDRAPLLLTSLPGIKRAEIDTATRSLWRYRVALPMQVDDPISMGEGCTPLIRQSLDG